MSSKVWRVHLTEEFGYHVDVEAENREEAMTKVRSRLNDPNDDVQPVEDDGYHEGYVVQDAEEISRDVADLEV